MSEFTCVSACWRGGKPQERQVQPGCLQRPRAGPDHHDISPVPVKTTRVSEGYPAEFSQRKKEGALNPDEYQIQLRLLRRGMMWRASGTMAGRFIWGSVAPEQCNHDSNLMGLRLDSSVLWKVRWPVWTHHLAPPVAMKRDTHPQRATHPMVRDCSPWLFQAKLLSVWCWYLLGN